MDHFAGLDVSVKETSVCIVDERSRHGADMAAGPSWAMCGRLLVGKGFLRVCSIGRSSHVFGL